LIVFVNFPEKWNAKIAFIHTIPNIFVEKNESFLDKAHFACNWRWFYGVY